MDLFLPLKINEMLKCDWLGYQVTWCPRIYNPISTLRCEK